MSLDAEHRYLEAEDKYMETQVLSADPLELTRLLYRGASESIGAAIVHLREGDILARGRAISKAQCIFLELKSSLDHTKSPDLCDELARLYAYMFERLSLAHIEQKEGPLLEVRGLIQTLLSSWEAIAVKHTQAEPTIEPEYPPALPDRFGMNDYEPYGSTLACVG
jgi:flagellar secretion chaperone FliS